MFNRSKNSATFEMKPILTIVGYNQLDTINYYCKELYFKHDKVPEFTSGIVLSHLQAFHHEKFCRNFSEIYPKVPKLPRGARISVLQVLAECGITAFEIIVDVQLQ